jgi:chemotaxis response regulator CheB
MTRVAPDLSMRNEPPSPTLRLSVLIADADAGFRALVRRHLGRSVVVVGDVGDAEEAVRLARRLRPDVVLMDITMPPLGGAEAARRIKADRTHTKVVLLGDGIPNPFPHADALLPREKVRLGILSQLGRIGGATRKRTSAHLSRTSEPARRRRARSRPT